MPDAHSPGPSHSEPSGARVGVEVGVSVAVGVSLAVAVGVSVGVCDGVFVGVLVGVCDGVSLGVPVGVSVGVSVGVPVGVSVGVSVGVPVAVPVGVSVGVSEGVSVGVPVGVIVGVSVGVPEGVSVGVTVGVTVAVGCSQQAGSPAHSSIATGQLPQVVRMPLLQPWAAQRMRHEDELQPVVGAPTQMQLLHAAPDPSKHAQQHCATTGRGIIVSTKTASAAIAAMHATNDARSVDTWIGLARPPERLEPTSPCHR